MKRVNFLDLGLGCGQMKSGLERSGEVAWAELAKSYPLKKFFKLKGKCRSDSVPCFNSQELDLPISLYRTCYLSALSSLKSGRLSLFWGGDHSLSLSTVQAFIDEYPNGKVIWIDAHADLNTPETSPTGNFHGMPVAYLLGIRNSPIRTEKSKILENEQIRYLGLRDLDPFEVQYLKNTNLVSYSKSKIDQVGIHKVCQEISYWVGSSAVHISFDIDVIDPHLAPSTGVPVDGGFGWNELNSISREFSQLPGLKSMDIVEINPELGDEESVRSTYQMAYQFLEPFLFSTRRFYDSSSSNFERKYPNATAGNFSFPAPDPF